MFLLAITTVALSDATVSILNIHARAVGVSSGWTPPWEVPGIGLMISCVVGMQFALLRIHQAEFSSGYHATLKHQQQRDGTVSPRLHQHSMLSAFSAVTIPTVVATCPVALLSAS